MLILAVDTTLGACSAAVLDDAQDKALGHLHERMPQGHAERLAGMTAEVMGQAGVGFDALHRIAVTTGPGTFTGVRIGLAMARGSALALGVPVVGISTLQALAGNVASNPEDLPITVIMDARREAVYTQTFSPELEPLDEAACVRLEELAGHVSSGDRMITGSGVRLVAGLNDCWRPAQVSDLPDSRVVARLAAALPPPAKPPAPIYLRPADAKPQRPLVELSELSVNVTSASALHSDVLSAIHGECFVSGWDCDAIRSMIESPGTTTLIAMAGDEPAGFIMMRAAAGEAEIITLCVRPQMRRRGVAKQLLRQALANPSIQQATEIFLEVRADDVAAKALYEAASFSVAGERRGYYKLEDGSRADAVIMKQVR